MNLEEWRESGLQLIKALRVRGEEESFRRLLSELYPKTAHFIFELFQNAEDTEAEEVKFVLNKEGLVFQHDGPKLFDEKNVIAITSFANSTKRNDPTSIGKFGVGFKAVFAYTNTPEIHSGEFHFRIHDLVVPEFEGVPNPRMGERETNFTFPFNNPEKLPEKAIVEIESGLQGLGHNTLLFLTHIERVEYRLTDGTLGSLQRFDHDNGHIEISSNCAGNRISSRWLRFQKSVKVTDEEGKIKECAIAIAFKLEEEKDSWKVVPANPGEVSIYFPAEKETSNLRFHMHAPFASTVARDSVRDCSANKELRNHLAMLVVESLFKIRDQGLLTVNFLAVLPNHEDNLSKFYEPIRVAIVEAFKNEALTPTRNGTHAPATNLYRGPAKIARVLDDADLSLLTGYDPPLWAVNPPLKNQREDRFLDSLKIDNWAWSELSNAISSLDDNKREPIEAWFAQKDDAWLMGFYGLLGEALDQNYEFSMENLRIVRVESEHGDENVIPSEAFFLPEQETIPPRDIRFVKPAVYTSGRPDSQKEFAVSFLKYIGVRPFDAKTLIELKLGYYDNPFNLPGETYYGDLQQFIAYWKKNFADAEIFRKHSFLLGVNAEGLLNFYKPSQLCLDAPYEETGLAEFSKTHRMFAIWDGYKAMLPESAEDFIDFVKSIGVMHKLNVERVSTDQNPYRSDLRQDYYQYNVKWTNTAINEDYSIPGIEQYLAVQTILASRLIWDALTRADRRSMTARFRPNQQYTIRETPSQLVSHLMPQAWIPDKTGVFRKPEDMTTDDLRTDFPYDDRNGLLTAIGFGEHANKQSAQYQAQNDAAKEMGFDSAEEAKVAVELAQLARETGKSLSELRSVFQHHQPDLPEKSVQKPSIYIKKVLEDWSNAPTSESEIRDRTIQVGLEAEVIEAKEYLRNLYENPDGQLICQSCHEEMPFKVGEKYYFEAIQYVRGLGKRHRASRIALCPNCAAMYQHAKETSDDELRSRLIELGADENISSVSISVRLAGRECSLYFVGSHWLTLKTILSAN